MKTKLIILFLIFATTMMAQELKVKSFSTDKDDISALTNPIEDFNGDICALVKVNMGIPDATFKGDTLKTAYKDGIYFIYLTPGATYLDITAPKVHTLNYTFTEEIKGGNTYSLVIDYPFFKYDMFEYISMCDRGWGTDSIPYDLHFHFAWPTQIAGLTKSEFLEMQKTLIQTLFGNDVKSVNIKKILSDDMKAWKSREMDNINFVVDEFYLEKRQGNFLIFRKVHSYNTGLEDECDNSKHHLLYNTRTKKIITSIKDLNIDVNAAYKEIKQDAYKQVREYVLETEQRKPNKEDYDMYTNIPELKDFIEGQFMIDDDLRILTYPIFSGIGEWQTGDVHLKIRDYLNQEFIDDWYGQKVTTKF